jgi:putative iron-dependent peroxidase
LSSPQTGIFSVGDAAQSYLEFALRDGAAAAGAASAVAKFQGPRSTVQGVDFVVGFRPELWRSIAPDDTPAKLESFRRDLVGPDGYTMPATQADLFFWIAGASYDNIFDVATEAVDELQALATLVREFRGWPYQHSRDLTGFQDGTENPNLIEAPGVALIDEGQPGAGGSVLLFQQWKHDADAWRALSDAEQERVIGRTKPDSIEFKGNKMPPDSHVARTQLNENGAELKIFRRNAPYGTVSDHGTLFVGFAKEQYRLARMLERMAGIGDGVRDALTRYSRPLTGAYYFVPALSALARFA